MRLNEVLADRHLYFMSLFVVGRAGEKVKDIGFRTYFQIPLNLSSVRDDVMLRIKRSAIRRFYFSPRRMFRIVRDVPKNPRLLASALLAVKLSFREDVQY